MKISTLFGLLIVLTVLALLPPSSAAVLAQGDPTPSPILEEIRSIFGASDSDDSDVDMEDWVLLEGDGVSLMAPPVFEGGSVEDVLEMIDVAEDMLGEEFEAILELVRQNPDLYKLFAFAPEWTEEGVMTNINVAGTEFPMEIAMDEILELLPASLPSSIDVVDSEVIELGDYEEVGKLTLDFEIMGLEQRLTMYVYLIDEQLFNLTITTAASALEERAAIFEQMAATFTVED
jgi:hypothetical protein